MKKKRNNMNSFLKKIKTAINQGNIFYAFVKKEELIKLVSLKNKEKTLKAFLDAEKSKKNILLVEKDSFFKEIIEKEIQEKFNLNIIVVKNINDLIINNFESEKINIFYMNYVRIENENLFDQYIVLTDNSDKDFSLKADYILDKEGMLC